MPAPPADPIDRTQALAAATGRLDAIDELTAANRQRPDHDVERRLVELRHAAFADVVGDPAWPWPDEPARPRLADGLPPLDKAWLSAEAMRDAILRYGAAYVPGLLTGSEAAELRQLIDDAFAAHDRHRDGAPLDAIDPAWQPFPIAVDKELAGTRGWVRDGGGVWTGESPRALFRFLDILEGAGVRDLVQAYLGERPALSLGKSTLRRVPLDSGGEWHQDGAFLGTGIRTINLWVTLTDCGVDAPGLEVLPRRLDGLAATGTHGTWFDWAVAPSAAEDAADGVPFLWPEFRAGDALLFDELFLHRTAVAPTMSKERHAIETWMFAPSVYPGDQIPLVW